MGFWGRILSLFLSKDIDDNLLLLQMNEALQEERVNYGILQIPSLIPML